MKNSIIADTGFWYALINEDDHFHQQAVRALKNIEENLISTWPVITEASYLIQSRVGQQEACEFLASYHEGLFEIYDIAGTYSAHGQTDEKIRRFTDGFGRCLVGHFGGRTRSRLHSIH